MSVTMKDIAQLTGLSLGTVSNYINNKTNVSKQKGERIEEAIKELGYTVNITARNLKTNSFHCVGVLISSFSYQFMLNVVSYIELGLREYGYDMIVLSYNGDLDCLYKQLRYLTQKTDGILFVPITNMESNVIKKLQRRTPLVMFDEALKDEVCDRILVNNTQIMEQSVDHVIKKGHTKIALIAGSKKGYTTIQRIQGYKNAYVKNSLVVEESLIVYGDYNKRSGYEGAMKVINNHQDVTAIFVVGYRMTLGVLAAIKEKGLKDKILIIGYDASDIQDIIDSKLGYVYQPYKEIAESMVATVMKRINGDYSNFPATIEVKAELRD